MQQVLDYMSWIGAGLKQEDIDSDREFIVSEEFTAEEM